MTNQNVLALVCGFSLLLTATYGQNKQSTSESKSNIHIESLMSAAEFKSCGLNKLTPDEIAHLDSWLLSFGVRLLSRRDEESKPTGTSDVIESQIDGEFHGWDGETIFKLTNGQIWQQAQYDYEYEYAYRPEVTIYKTTGGYKMKVEDMEDTIYVKRIK
jgi:hypothetical protein